jgi:DNA-binding MltR family transcriptional regulator
MLVAKIRRRDAEFINNLFQNRGPLSDFNSKIMIAEAFGYINKNFADELHVMRQIRNTFAHAKIPLTFATEAIDEKLRDLKVLELLHGMNIPVPGDSSIQLDLKGKSGFLFATRLVLLMFDFVSGLKPTPKPSTLGTATKP